MKKMMMCAVALAAGVSVARVADIHTPLATPVEERATPAGGPVELVRGGALRFAVVVDKKAESRAAGNRAEKSIAPAVALLCDEFERVTGRRPAVIDETDEAALATCGAWLVVGDSALARANGIDARTLPDQGFEVKTFPKGILLVGNDSSLLPGFNDCPKMRRRGSSLGTYYGAVDFVQRVLGVAYFFPGEFGTYRPKVSDLAMPAVHYGDEPWFNNRFGLQYNVFLSLAPNGKGMKVLSPYLGKVPKAAEWNAKWRYGGTNPIGGGHSPSPIEFGRDHPDDLKTIFYTSPSGKFWYSPTTYMANYFNVVDLRLADIILSDWKRVIDSDGQWNLGGNRPMTNLKALYFGCTDVLMTSGDMKDDPEVKRLGLMPDSLLARGEEFAFANVYGRFHQYLCRRAKEMWPDCTVWLMPYYNCYRAAPDPRWRLPDNAEILFCARSFPGRVRSAKCASKEREMLSEWYEALGGRPAQRLWLYGDRQNYSARAIAGEFVGEVPKAVGKYLGRAGGVCYDLDGRPGDVWFAYYASWACMMSEWNPEFDVDAAIDAHWPLMYGEEAGRHLRRFHRILKDAYLQCYVDSDEPYPQYPVAFIDEMETCLAKAEAAIRPGSVEMRRFRLLSAPWPEEFAKRRRLAAYVPPTCAARRVPAGAARDDAFWAGVPAVPLMDPKSGARDETGDTRIRFAYDDRFVYVRVEGDYPPHGDPAASLWANDTVELFLSPGLGQEEKFMVAFDPAGQVFSMQERLRPIPQPRDASWRPKALTVACRQSADAWRADVAWPFDGMGRPAPKAGEAWSMNAVRTRRPTDGNESVVGSAFTSGNNHDVGMFGVLRFE